MGWIGCGRQAGEMLLPALVQLPVELTAVCSRTEESLDRVASRYAVKRRYRDYRRLLDEESGNLDAVGLSVGPREHAEMAAEALSRGLAVFMEKPPGENARDARKILDASRAAGRPAAVGFHKRFSAGNRIAANILREGSFGKIAGITAEYTTSPAYFKDDPTLRSFFLHHCVHYFDLLPYLAGPVETVDVRANEIGPGKIFLSASLRFAGGALGTLVLGTVQSRGNPVEFLRIYGDHRRIEVENVARIRYYRDPAFKAGGREAALRDGEDALLWEPNYTAAAYEDEKGYMSMLAGFLDVLDGKPSWVADAEAGLSAMKIMEACWTSWKERREVPVSS